MKRKADGYLEAWYKNPDKKFLIVKGARQVGKTKTIREFAGKHYDSIIEINFFTHPNYKGIDMMENCFRLASMFTPHQAAIKHKAFR